MIMAIITLIIYLVIIGLLYWLARYVIDHLAFPEPVARILHLLVVVLFTLIVIVVLLHFLGVSDLGMPRLG